MTLPNFPEDRLVPERAAQYLGVAAQSLAIDRCSGRLGKIPFYKVGRRVYYRRSDLEAWLESRRVASPAAA